MSPVSLYIHVPFCVHRCGYCDFNTYAGLQGLIPAYVEAVRREIEYVSNKADKRLKVHTVYFGGGTPSLLPEDGVESILEAVHNSFDVSVSPEISLEANPGTVSKEYLEHIHDLGINRLSLGMQSADPGELLMLERQHSFEDVIQAVEWARLAGIANLNLDLIYGLPRQPLKSWESSLDDALSLNPEHLSLYALTLERGTPMQHLVDTGKLPKPDDDLAADMYDTARDLLARSGFIQYEISNWARRDQANEVLACQHNLQYWRNLPYIGIGAGAHGFIAHHRTVDVLTPAAYINRMADRENPRNDIEFPSTPATTQSKLIDRDTEIGETMMMGLRLVDEGVSNQAFEQRFGITLQERFGKQVEHLRSIGLLEWAGNQNGRLRLTPKGYLLGNQVFIEFI